jgi:hypothetical protein
MGGFGSSRWRGYTRAMCAEECLFLIDTTVFRRQFGSDTSDGMLGLSRQNRQIAKLPYALARTRSDKFTLSLAGRTLTLTATPLHFGGFRWFFRCPKCAGRSRKLYAPTGEQAFFCRTCWHLTYLSCQDKGTFVGLVRRLRRAGLLPEWRWQA